MVVIGLYLVWRMLCLLWYLLVSPSGHFGSGLGFNSAKVAYQLLPFDFIDSIIYKHIARSIYIRIWSADSKWMRGGLCESL